MINFGYLGDVTAKVPGGYCEGFFRVLQGYCQGTATAKVLRGYCEGTLYNLISYL
jgi:hypothetical protein